MSSRQDTYKSLCLLEAQKSPLHYRHGCVIVRGGKVIGKGHNHYRPSFNGGALATGRLPASTHGADLNSIKQKQKSKSKQQNPSQRSGGGHLADTPLSMHSEMMAIRSALSLSAHHSGASARGAEWLVKGSFKLPGSNKRKERLRNYVEAVCAAAEGGCLRIETLAQDDVWGFEPNTCRLEFIQQQHLQRAQWGPEEGEETLEEEERDEWRERSSQSSRVSVSIPL